MSELHARAREPEGPDRHYLTVRFYNDPEWYFRVREEQTDGTLVPVVDELVVMVLRGNPRTPVPECPSVTAEQKDGAGLYSVSLRYEELERDSTPFQLDVLRGGRRKTFAYGTIAKEGLL